MQCISCYHKIFTKLNQTVKTKDITHLILSYVNLKKPLQISPIDILDLIDYCYKKYTLAYVLYKGKRYYNCSQWSNEVPKPYNKQPQNQPSYDCYSGDDLSDEENQLSDFKINLTTDNGTVVHMKNFETLNKHLCHFQKKLINPSEDYEYVYNENEVNYESIEMDLDLFKAFEMLNLNDTLNFRKNLILKNISGENKDHRGSNHTKLYLAFYSEVECEAQISMKTFLDALYDLKSHKFDYWYELYSGGKEVKIKDNEIYVTITFDHGS